MLRLLLVDDNQSIHKIAETLLAATDIELTCASSGAEALELAASGGPFDAALLDTTMLGMDGWELLERFRHDPATARLPIAMMAGVLDVVDPETVKKAPIQGFLKKPVELRDLADRVRALAATPVEAPVEAPEAPSSFATMPYFKLSDHPLPGDDLLLLEPGDVLAEAEPGPEAEAGPSPAREDAEAPVLDLDEAAFEMLIPESPAPAGEPAPEFEEPADEISLPSLELEELDLESLKVLPSPEEPAAGPVPDEIPTVEEVEETPEIREYSTEDTLKTSAQDLGIVTDELPDLGPEVELPESPAPQAPAMALPEDWADESETLLELSPETTWTPEPTAAPALAEHSDFGPDSFLDVDPGPDLTPAFLPELPEQITPLQFTELAPEDELIQAPELDALPEAVDAVLANAARDTVPWGTTLNLAQEIPPTLEWEADAAPATASLEAPPELPALPQPGADPLAAILADPVLMDRLAKAVVARLGDQILREIAWEVMPELAGRLPRA